MGLPSILLPDGGQAGLLGRGRPARQAEGGLDHKAEDRQARGQVGLPVEDETELRAMNGPGL